MTRTIARTLLASACLVPTAVTSVAAQPMPAVLDLFNALPQPPATAETAATWFDVTGALVHPALSDAKAKVALLKKGIETRRAHAEREAMSQRQRTVAGLGQGMANAGIDMGRMQTDPAYAAQMQAKLKSMTPQQLMAFATTMAAPSAGPGPDNPAWAAAHDNDAARAAADVAMRYTTAMSDRIAARAAEWTTSDATVATLTSSPPAVGMKKPTQQDGEGCDQPCRAALQAYAAAVRAVLVARDTRILAARRIDFDKARATAAPIVREADQHLRATRFGDGSTSEHNKSLILGLSELALGEIEALVIRLEQIAEEGARTLRAPEGIVIDGDRP